MAEPVLRKMMQETHEKLIIKTRKNLILKNELLQVGEQLAKAKEIDAKKTKYIRKLGTMICRYKERQRRWLEDYRFYKNDNKMMEGP